MATCRGEVRGPVMPLHAYCRIYLKVAVMFIIKLSKLYLNLCIMPHPNYCISKCLCISSTLVEKYQCRRQLRHHSISCVCPIKWNVITANPKQLNAANHWCMLIAQRFPFYMNYCCTYYPHWRCRSVGMGRIFKSISLFVCLSVCLSGA